MNEIFVQIITSTHFQQFFPFVVLFGVPFSAIFLVKTGPGLKSLFFTFVMVFGSLLPWNWGSSGTSAPGRAGHHEKKRGRKKGPKGSPEVELGGGHGGSYDGYYPGLVNISGTYCFMNSTVQALSSLSYLQPHLDAIHTKAELLDVPSPVVDTLRDLCRRLNTPHSRPSSIRPLDLISVLSSQSETSGRSNSLFNSREHQDAQELFQLLSECIKSELSAIDKEGVRDRGLGGLSQATEVKELGKSIFDGLTANRRSCVVCGYTEAVMHFPLDNWQLAVPQMTSACLLEDCFSDYTRLEVLRDCICRKCSILATHRRLLGDIETLSKVENPSTSKKKRLKDVKKMEAKVKAAIEEGRIEDDIPEVRMEKVFSAMSTKQAMIARPPPVLALHINRSMHFTHYAAKNNVRVLFPEVLDLTPFTTSGNLSTVPTSSMSTPSPSQRSSFSPSSMSAPPRSRSGTPTPETQKDSLSRTIYRLSAVVCHYGAHSFGHYVCFRRKPRNASEGERWKPPKLVMEAIPPVKQEPSDHEPDLHRTDTSGTEENAEGFEDYVWDDYDPTTARGTGRGWLRISDDSVSECGIETVLQEGSGAFMLYYERAIILPYPSEAVNSALNGSAKYDSPYAARNVVNGGYQGVGVGVGTPLDSEETLKPETMTTMSSISVNTDASVGSLVGSVGSVKEKMLASQLVGSWGSSSLSGSPPVLGARVIRSVAAGRGKRSASAAPSLNGSIALSTSPSSTGSSMLLSSSPHESSGTSGPASMSSTKPIPVPMANGHSHRHHDMDGFEPIDAPTSVSPLSASGVSARASSLPAQLNSSLSSSSLSSITSGTSPNSPSSSVLPQTSDASVSPTSSAAKKRKHKSKHKSQHPPPSRSPVVDLKA